MELPKNKFNETIKSALLNESFENDDINNDKIYYIYNNVKYMSENFVKNEAQKIIDNNPFNKILIEKYKNDKKDKIIFFENLEWNEKDPYDYPFTGNFKFIGYSNVNNSKEILFNDFINYCYSFLKLDVPCNIKFLSKREGQMTGGSYDINTYDINILCGNRCIADIFRSLAHELVHHKQNITKEIENHLANNEIPDVGGKIEDDANSIAGQIIKSYCKHQDNKMLYDINF